MSNDMTFSAWLEKWLRDNYPEWTQKTFAKAVGASEAALSTWVNGHQVPRDLRQMTRIAEITETDVYYLCLIAYGFEPPAHTDDAMRDPLLREADDLIAQLGRRAPDLIPAAAEIVRGLLRAARKRGSGQGGGQPSQN